MNEPSDKLFTAKLGDMASLCERNGAAVFSLFFDGKYKKFIYIVQKIQYFFALFQKKSYLRPVNGTKSAKFLSNSAKYFERISYIV